MKNNLRVDISQVNEQTLEQTETGGAFHSGFGSHGRASYRREQETVEDRKDPKNQTAQSGTKNPYPVFSATEIVQTYEELK